ncbi:MAG TPA: hypothetical protein VL742_17775 [Casimicrobiaceae bacterium]|nr:hypothetical protein [Casimicrobiaceae bacterium]
MQPSAPLHRPNPVSQALAIAAVLIAAMLLASPPALADATGFFASAKRRLDVDGTYAFWAKSAAPGGGEVIKVAVSNAYFTEGFFDDYYDRENAIDKVFVDDQAKVVYFEFEPGGKYHGLSYFFAPGENCGYCFDSAVQSTVRVTDGHLKGRIAFKRAGTNPAFDIELDTPLPSKDRGTALPSGGGEPGRAYVAFHKALNAGDRKGTYALLDSKHKALWTKYDKEGVDVMGPYWSDFHSKMSTVSVTGGFVRGDHAVVLFDGGSKLIEHLHGEALMRRENDVWLLRDELVSVGRR